MVSKNIGNHQLRGGKEGVNMIQEDFRRLYSIRAYRKDENARKRNGQSSKDEIGVSERGGGSLGTRLAA